jgi:hypothetical protein
MKQFTLKKAKHDPFNHFHEILLTQASDGTIFRTASDRCAVALVSSSTTNIFPNEEMEWKTQETFQTFPAGNNLMKVIRDQMAGLEPNGIATSALKRYVAIAEAIQSDLPKKDTRKFMFSDGKIKVNDLNGFFAVNGTTSLECINNKIFKLEYLKNAVTFFADNDNHIIDMYCKDEKTGNMLIMQGKTCTVAIMPMKF